mgnify:CR=1 FL=1
MDEKVYGYMDWPRIEAIVYGEETAPRDVIPFKYADTLQI